MNRNSLVQIALLRGGQRNVSGLRTDEADEFIEELGLLGV